MLSLLTQVDRCEAEIRTFENQRGKKTSKRERAATKLALEKKLMGLQDAIDHTVKSLRRSLTGLLSVRTNLSSPLSSSRHAPFSLRPLPRLDGVCRRG